MVPSSLSVRPTGRGHPWQIKVYTRGRSKSAPIRRGQPQFLLSLLYPDTREANFLAHNNRGNKIKRLAGGGGVGRRGRGTDGNG
ncbi:hypothetical protein SLEP1_g32245 [Rubroshorea leprosula]|uniref:Uncharacterized protein n=1 Tax=Rubroshorea leprosula TaxID=152421 RepID=A0AAV5KCN6_9ROSI|nr:hypothetical protein SLEP1_g32245 [Rubroshorea leprosula]